MLDLLNIYWLSVFASSLLGGGLALLGVQLAARDKAMQTMCVGQGAMLGVLLGIGLTQIFHGGTAWKISLPFALAASTATITFTASERLVKNKSSSSNTHFAALFSILLAGGFLISSLFPALENHMTQKYFGDLATMNEQSAWTVSFLGLTLIVTLFKYQRPISRDSFAQTILGSRTTPTRLLFSIGTLLTLCIAVQLVGFLFTVACLFLPTSILSFGSKNGLQRHTVTCCGVAIIACCGGFLFTLWQTHLPTVPTIIIFIASIAFFMNFLRPWRVSTKT